MSYHIKSAIHQGASMFYVGVETGALYVMSRAGKMLCVDANGSAQSVGREYGIEQGHYRHVKPGEVLTIEVGK